MNNFSSRRLRLWECAMLFAFSLTLVTGVWAAGSQSALADKVVRLHVIANSDSDADQALKLRVRDAVLAAAGDCLDGITDRRSAENILSGKLQALADAGAAEVAAQGFDYPVSVSLENCWFPTKEYDGFALPAGTYRAVRVVIGEGAGRNWWCVLYPGLCSFAQGGYALPAEKDLVCGQYILRFRLVDWAHRLTARRQTVLLAG